MTVIVANNRPDRVITVVNYAITLGAAGTLQFRSSGTPISGAFDLEGKGGISCPDAESGWMQTAPGEDLEILTTGGRAQGHLAHERSGP